MFRNTNPLTINQPVGQDDKGIFSSSKTFSGTLFFIGVLFIAIAALFFDEKCDNHAIYYLLFSGILQTTIFIIRAFNKEENFFELSILGSLSAAVLIWGSGNNYSWIESLVWLTVKFSPIIVIFKKVI